MKTLFILSSLNKGGIENYIVQLAEVFKKKGEDVIVLSLSDKFDMDLLERVESYAKVITLKEISNNYFLPNRATFNTLFGLNNKKINAMLTGVSKILAPGSYPVVIANHIAATLGDCSYVAGVYHKNEFLWRSPSYHRNVEKKIFKRLLRSGKVHVYGNNLLHDLCKEYCVISNNVKPFSVGIKLNSQKDIFGSSSSKRIIIIGRFVEFKTFIKGMIENFNQILMDQPGSVLEIYGYGPCKEVYVDLVGALGLGDNIKVESSVSFDEMRLIFNDAFCVVGNGTTILHSSSYGIPSVIGIDSNPSFTSPGLFSEARLDSYNELGSYSEGELQDINSIIKSLFSLNESDYYKTCRKHIEITGSYDIENNYKDFNSLFDSPNPDVMKINLVRYAWSFLFSRKGKGFDSRFNDAS